jgi:hypothetical protein
MINVKNLLLRNKITPEQRAALNREVHLLMPELAEVEEILQARNRQGLKISKDDSKYLYLQDTLMFIQAGVVFPYKSILKSYQSVFGDRLSDNFLRFIEKLLPAAEEFESSSSSSSSSKDHAATVLSFSESSAEQVWIFDQLSVISCFIGITIHFISLRTASERRQRNSNHHHHHHYQHHHPHQRIMLQLCYRLHQALFNRFGSLLDQLNLIICIIDITIHFNSRVPASAR